MPFLVEMCCGGGGTHTEKVLWKTGEQRRLGVLLYCIFIISIFLSLSYTVSSCCCCQRMLIQIAADKTVAYTPFIDVSLMNHVHVTVCMKRAEFSKLKDPPIHTQVLNVFQATGQYSVLSLSLHVRLCKCVQKIT